MDIVGEREECQTLRDMKMGTLNEDCRTPRQASSPRQPHSFCHLLEILGITALRGEEERAQASGCPSVPPAILPTPNEAEPNSVLCG